MSFHERQASKTGMHSSQGHVSPTSQDEVDYSYRTLSSQFSRKEIFSTLIRDPFFIFGLAQIAIFIAVAWPTMVFSSEAQSMGCEAPYQTWLLILAIAMFLSGISKIFIVIVGVINRT